MALGLVANPLSQELAVGKFSCVGDLCLSLGLAGVEAEEGGDGIDHVGECKVRGAGHDVRAVELDKGKGDAALGLAYTGLNEGAQQRGDGAAGRAPRGSPECE